MIEAYKDGLADVRFSSRLNEAPMAKWRSESLGAGTPCAEERREVAWVD